MRAEITRMRTFGTCTMSQLEKDVAQYILAYLARQGYSHTMSAFLQECTVLPANTTLMVLPETSLSAIIAEHKARSESGLLLEKLGPQASWDALWEKLQHYLNQLRSLANALLEPHQSQPLTKRPTERKRHYRKISRLQQQYNMASSAANTLPPPPTTAVEPPPTTAVDLSATSTASSSNPFPASVPSSSPRKRKNPVRAPPFSEAQVTPSASLAPQQLLDVLLDDESLQQHLASLINSSLLGDGEDGEELTERALDNILALTTNSQEPVVQEPRMITGSNVEGGLQFSCSEPQIQPGTSGTASNDN